MGGKDNKRGLCAGAGQVQVKKLRCHIWDSSPSLLKEKLGVLSFLPVLCCQDKGGVYDDIVSLPLLLTSMCFHLIGQMCSFCSSGQCRFSVSMKEDTSKIFLYCHVKPEGNITFYIFRLHINSVLVPLSVLWDFQLGLLCIVCKLFTNYDSENSFIFNSCTSYFRLHSLKFSLSTFFSVNSLTSLSGLFLSSLLVFFITFLSNG